MLKNKKNKLVLISIYFLTTSFFTTPAFSLTKVTTGTVWSSVNNWFDSGYNNTDPKQPLYLPHTLPTLSDYVNITSSVAINSTASAYQLYLLGGDINQTGNLTTFYSLIDGTYTQSGSLHKANQVFMGLLSGSHGTYNLKSGNLNTFNSIVGNEGTGTFTQTGGTHTVTQDFFVGGISGGNGTYQLKLGDLKTFNSDVGNAGTGTFTQTGGTHTVTQYFNVGGNIGGTGTYDLKLGDLKTFNSLVGNAGTGTFTQTGGVHTVSQALVLGNTSTGDGTYNLSGTGTPATTNLTTINTIVGALGKGTFTQSGGSSHNVNNALNVGVFSGSSGTYKLQGGDLKTFYSIIGDEGIGTFTQTDGTHTVGQTLALGNKSTGDGTYNLSGTGTPATTNLTTINTIVGALGKGTFTQSGGSSHNVNNALNVGVFSGSSGTYKLQGGDLKTFYSIIGDEGIGTFTQTDGTHTVGQTLALGNKSTGDGTYNLSGTGTPATTNLTTINTIVGLFGKGTFNQTGGVHNISESLLLGNQNKSTGQYNLDGGQLFTNFTILGLNGGSATFIQNVGSEHTINNALQIGIDSEANKSSGSYELKGGILTIGNNFNGQIFTGNTKRVEYSSDSQTSIVTESPPNIFMQTGGKLIFNGNSNFVNMGGGTFQKTAGDLEFHLKGLAEFYNPDTIQLLSGSKIKLAGNVSIFRESEAVSKSSVNSLTAGGVPLMNASSIDLGVTSHITRSGSSVQLGDVNFTDVPKFETNDPNAPTRNGYMMPSIILSGTHNTQTLALMNVYEAAKANPLALEKPLVKISTINEAQNLINSSDISSASTLSRAVYGQSIPNNYVALSSFSAGDLFMTAYQAKGNSAGDITISIRGTANFGNLITDLGFTGISTNSMKQYVNNLSYFVADMAAANPDAKIRLTGHSLGGGLAELIGSRMGVDAIGFNAPPIGNIFNLYSNETNVISGLGNIHLNDRYNLINISMVGDVVSGLPLIQKGQEIILKNDPLINYFNYVQSTSGVSNPATDVSNQLVGVISTGINHSMDFLNYYVQTNSPAQVLLYDGNIVDVNSDLISDPSNFALVASRFLIQSDFLSKPIAAYTSILNGQVFEGLSYIGGADPDIINGFLFDSKEASPNYKLVGLPDLEDPTIKFNIEVLVDGNWTVIGSADPSTVFDFGELGTNTFRVMSDKPIATTEESRNVFFALTFAESGIFDGAITPLDANGNFITPVPEPEVYAMMLMGICFIVFSARRRKVQLH